MLALRDMQIDTYGDYLNNLLYIEEHQMHIDINQYSMESVPMRKEAKSGLIVVDVSYEMGDAIGLIIWHYIFGT